MSESVEQNLREAQILRLKKAKRKLETAQAEYDFALEAILNPPKRMKKLEEEKLQRIDVDNLVKKISTEFDQKNFICQEAIDLLVHTKWGAVFGKFPFNENKAIIQVDDDAYTIEKYPGGFNCVPEVIYIGQGQGKSVNDELVGQVVARSTPLSTIREDHDISGDDKALLLTLIVLRFWGSGADATDPRRA